VKHVGVSENPFIAAARLKQVKESVAIYFLLLKIKYNTLNFLTVKI